MNPNYGRKQRCSRVVGGKETVKGRAVMETMDREVTAVGIGTKRFYQNFRWGITMASAPQAFGIGTKHVPVGRQKTTQSKLFKVYSILFIILRFKVYKIYIDSWIIQFKLRIRKLKQIIGKLQNKQIPNRTQL